MKPLSYGKGLCPECAGKYEPILCKPCSQKIRKSEKWRSVFSLLLLAALFVIGFRWSFLATKGFEDMRWMSGYTLMAIWPGYLFVEKYIPYKMVAGTNGQRIVYHIVKLLLFVVIGVFTAPFTCLWTVFRIIKAFR